MSYNLLCPSCSESLLTQDADTPADLAGDRTCPHCGAEVAVTVEQGKPGALSILQLLCEKNPHLAGGDGKPVHPISAQAFDEAGLPFISGCELCGSTLGPWNSYPSTTGYIRCRSCLDGRGFATLEAFEAFCNQVDSN